MIVNSQYRFIFLKTTKTAGTSVQSALSEFCSDGDIVTRASGQPDPALDGREGQGDRQNLRIPFRSYKPADWLKMVRTRRRLRFRSHSPARFVREYVGRDVWDSCFKFCIERNPFDKAISRYYFSTVEPRPPMMQYFASAPEWHLSNWGIYTIDDEIAVDFVCRYERLEEDLAHVAERVGLPKTIELPRAKGHFRKNRDHYSQVLGPDERAWIEKACAREIEAFGYGWEAPPTHPAEAPMSSSSRP